MFDSTGSRIYFWLSSFFSSVKCLLFWGFFLQFPNPPLSSCTDAPLLHHSHHPLTGFLLKHRCSVALLTPLSPNPLKEKAWMEIQSLHHKDWSRSAHKAAKSFSSLFALLACLFPICLSLPFWLSSQVIKAYLPELAAGRDWHPGWRNVLHHLFFFNYVFVVNNTEMELFCIAPPNHLKCLN